ncbi:DoxX family protein [Vibrio sp. S4M6]|uniref:DoxX family protein n=1 Tax=Vibrio sinus TaxID=2946865 RepID=UPI002029BC84|nr:DoxX family protein [Vibrio sinus]MCL9782916.1 DoxX family protein [Vibrio sinus]
MSYSIKSIVSCYDCAVEKSQYYFVPAFLLFLRIWIAEVFFFSGWVKVQDWGSTLFLFELEYQVPLLPWQLAAYLGTAAELILPIFIVFGLLTRPMAAILFIFNIIAVISYPVLWEKGFYDHQLWGLMILILVVWGPGPFSIDNWLKRRILSQ